MRLVLFFALILSANVFSADWYSRGGYEKCMDTVNGLLICREDYVNDFCYGKERTWIKNSRERAFLDRGKEMMWFDRNLVSVRKLNYKCQYHGWSRFKLVDGSWTWKCYINDREMEDSSCNGFWKR